MIAMKSKSTLRDHQLIMLDLLHQVDMICKKHNIPYYLFAGSLLGAVRHSGFIPWDDDVDVIMLRSDYNRFLSVAEKELDAANYFLQKEYSAHWPLHWSKIRRNGTTCLEKYYPKDLKTHLGIFIDVFPCDALSNSFLISRLQFIASKIIIAKSLNARGYITKSFVKRAVLACSKLFPLKALTNLVQLRGATDTESVHVFLGGGKRYKNSVFPRIWLEHQKVLTFEDDLFSVPEKYDALLTTLYGNYWIIPPEEERKNKEHSFFVDTEHSYETHLELYQTITFDVLTKSIR